MTAPTLSVVMPNHNHARYLPQALAAHLGQTVPPEEIIVIDDGSTDDSVAVLRRIAADNPRLRVIPLDRNVGVNAAVAIGLGEARGTHVAVAAADDLVLPHFAESALAALARWPQAGFSFSDSASLREADGSVQVVPFRLAPEPRWFSGADLVTLFRHNAIWIGSNTAVYRREALLAAGGFPPDLRWHADWFTTLALGFRHGAVYLPGVYCHFRVRSDSYSSGRRRQPAVQRDVVFATLALLQRNENADLAQAFRTAGLVPELSWRVLRWLAATARGRRHLTPHLVARLLVRGGWEHARAFTPAAVRRWMRAVAAWRAGRKLHQPPVRLGSV